MNWLLLLGLIAAYAWYVRGGGVASGRGRVARYRRWMRRAPLAFGGSALVALTLGGQIAALTTLPPEFAGIARHARYLAGFSNDPVMLKLAAIGGLCGGALIGILLSHWRMRRGKAPMMAGNLTAILPRQRSEFIWTTALGAAAGVVEELFFRLALPLFAALATSSAEFGFILATILFAFAHRYQGGVGMVFTGTAGALLATIYLATGDLWFAMLVHVLLNLNGLVLRPALLGCPPREMPVVPPPSDRL
ncbi:CPBP family intramembrane glutamic endopeptidase [Sphingomonas sp. LT1P40]|uniref:CPBP family intramembrane glutamic endopeptidase n=1 Tax=Alteristakelama amylovorans TaxID=3096166 RepID=UPI002FC5A884